MFTNIHALILATLLVISVPTVSAAEDCNWTLHKVAAQATYRVTTNTGAGSRKTWSIYNGISTTPYEAYTPYSYPPQDLFDSNYEVTFLRKNGRIVDDTITLRVYQVGYASYSSWFGKDILVVGGNGRTWDVDEATYASVVASTRYSGFSASSTASTSGITISIAWDYNATPHPHTGFLSVNSPTVTGTSEVRFEIKPDGAYATGSMLHTDSLVSAANRSWNETDIYGNQHFAVSNWTETIAHEAKAASLGFQNEQGYADPYLFPWNVAKGCTAFNPLIVSGVEVLPGVDPAVTFPGVTTQSWQVDLPAGGSETIPVIPVTQAPLASGQLGFSTSAFRSAVTAKRQRMLLRSIYEEIAVLHSIYGAAATLQGVDPDAVLAAIMPLPDLGHAWYTDRLSPEQKAALMAASVALSPAQLATQAQSLLTTIADRNGLPGRAQPVDVASVLERLEMDAQNRVEVLGKVNSLMMVMAIDGYLDSSYLDSQPSTENAILPIQLYGALGSTVMLKTATAVADLNPSDLLSYLSSLRAPLALKAIDADHAASKLTAASDKMGATIDSYITQPGLLRKGTRLLARVIDEHHPDWKPTTEQAWWTLNSTEVGHGAAAAAYPADSAVGSYLWKVQFERPDVEAQQQTVATPSTTWAWGDASGAHAWKLQFIFEHSNKTQESKSGDLTGKMNPAAKVMTFISEKMLIKTPWEYKVKSNVSVAGKFALPKIGNGFVSGLKQMWDDASLSLAGGTEAAAKIFVQIPRLWGVPISFVVQLPEVTGKDSDPLKIGLFLLGEVKGGSGFTNAWAEKTTYEASDYNLVIDLANKTMGGSVGMQAGMGMGFWMGADFPKWVTEYVQAKVSSTFMVTATVSMNNTPTTMNQVVTHPVNSTIDAFTITAKPKLTLGNLTWEVELGVKKPFGILPKGFSFKRAGQLAPFGTIEPDAPYQFGIKPIVEGLKAVVGPHLRNATGGVQSAGGNGNG